MKIWLCVLAVASALPVAARDKKPAGEIPDRAAFAKIRSYCIEARDFSNHDASDVETFVKRESKPKKLLSKLPWKLYRDCREGNPDAVIKVAFPVLRKMSVQFGTPQDPLQEPDPDEYITKAVLEISDPASARPLYKVEALPLDNGLINGEGVPSGDPPLLQRLNALYNAFSTLVYDVKRVSAAGRM